EALPALYRDARALIFPGEEDFGLTPLEAQASGRPVIALARGGALETVTPETGVFFSDQSAEGLAAAVRAFEALETGFRPEKARAQALGFTKTRFREGLAREIGALMSASGAV